MDEQTTEQTQPDPQKKIPELLRGIDGAPTQEQIDTWKTQFGDVYLSGFSEKEIFAWRPLRRPEFVQLQTQAAEKQFTQFQVEEETCRICVLWPALDWAVTKAGTASTLAEQIMVNSHFLTPQQAAYLVAKL